MWVVLIAGSTGSALGAVRPPNQARAGRAQETPASRAAGYRYGGIYPRAHSSQGVQLPSVVSLDRTFDDFGFLSEQL